MSKINIDGSGRLELPVSVVREIGAASLELVCHSNAHLLFSNVDCGFQLAGVLGEIAMVDVLSFLNMFRKTGALVVSLAGGEKEVSFLRGEIVAAASSFPEEDICTVLLEMGKLDQGALPKYRQLIAGSGGSGRVLVEKGVIAPKDLWLATRSQVENIVFNIFGASQGSFFFLEKEPEKEKMVRLAMTTQNMIMEGLRRVDERALFMRVIRSMDALPKASGKSVENLTAEEERLLKLIVGGGLDVRELLRRGKMSEFEGLRALYELINKGAVSIQDAPATAVAGDLGEILLVFNGALTALYRRVSAKNSEFLNEITTFLRQMPSPFSYVFKDVSLREDGTVDGRKVLTNLSGLEEQDKKRLLAEALSELIYMECMAAQRDLGQAESARLIQKVQEVPRRVNKLLVKKQFSEG
ncbi:hypothetical protein Pcar_0683 [Syntrophotalea carbinolica DSM 2380]|uniref:PatA-like N-terminal domain-containing protein n=1 Tax=Syntrophotalea carbinolica (strain DSM 2380 / NBRC 103641 / GraBd1) TaxID=338963 RepID=Q3A6R5_SYNC1|nr:DUF4388 domain-containing protein [Syntrophotalea carbinolica]ABA87942.1 hypothetical protein Pcar_0683 [Syntrophotalea carbinolica DSM 2380]